MLSGTGISYQTEGDEEQAFPVGTGDCLVHLALEHAHTIRAGDDGLVVLAFGQRHYAANTLLPRAGVSWLGPTWVLEGRRRTTPGRGGSRRATHLERARRATRRIVNVDDVPRTSIAERRSARLADLGLPRDRSAPARPISSWRRGS